jgi:hypothetical protein
MYKESVSKKISISTKRLAELEYIEKNLDKIISDSVKENCEDCKKGVCVVCNKDNCLQPKKGVCLVSKKSS